MEVLAQSPKCGHAEFGTLDEYCRQEIVASRRSRSWERQAPKRALGCGPSRTSDRGMMRGNGGRGNHCTDSYQDAKGLPLNPAVRIFHLRSGFIDFTD